MGLPIFVFTIRISVSAFLGNTLTSLKERIPNNMKKVAIVMGSDSDLPVVEKAIFVLKEYGVPFSVHVYSAHRTPDEAAALAIGARENGYGAIIAAAGKAAHLAGALAARTTLPVIGIPVKSSNLDGVDALLSTVQMPTGLPVATVAIDGAANAALLAIQMLAITDETLREKLDAARVAGKEKVLKKNAEITERYL
jgi:5-(carboxyamino)imidazole ribonucleotide mutase